MSQLQLLETILSNYIAAILKTSRPQHAAGGGLTDFQTGVGDADRWSQSCRQVKQMHLVYQVYQVQEMHLVNCPLVTGQ